MAFKLTMLLTLLGFFEPIFAQSAMCTPWMQFRVTDQGMPRLIQGIFKDRLGKIESEIKKDSRMELVTEETPEGCQAYTLADPQVRSLISQCPGIPDLTDELILSKSTLIRPFRLSLTEVEIEKIKIDLKEPVACDHNTCYAKIFLKDFRLQGMGELAFKDGQQEVLIPKSKWFIDSLETKDPITYEFIVKMNPQQVEVGEFARIPKGTSRLNIPAGALKLVVQKEISMNVISASKYQDLIAKRRAYQSKELEKVFAKLKDRKFFEDQIYDYLFFAVEHAVSAERRARGDFGTEEADRIRAQKEIELRGQLEAEGISFAELSRFEYSGDLNYPKVYEKLGAVKDALTQGQVLAEAEASGFKSTGAYTSMILGELIANFVLSSPQFIHHGLWFKNDLRDFIEDSINEHLARAPEHLNEVKKAPGLHLQWQVNRSELVNKIRLLTNRQAFYEPKDQIFINTEKEIQELKSKLRIVNKSIDDDWIDIQAAFEINLRTNGFKGHVIDLNNKENRCSAQQLIETPSKVSKEESYDFSGEISYKGFLDYIDYLYQNNNLSFCYGGTDYKNCGAGKRIHLKEKPTVTCTENSEFELNFTNVIEGYGEIETMIRGHFEACSGGICLNLSKVKSKPKTRFLKLLNFGAKLTPMGGLDKKLEETIKESAASLNKAGIRLPFAQVIEVVKNPKTCNTRVNFKVNQN